MRVFSTTEIYLKCSDCGMRSEGWVIERKNLVFKTSPKRVMPDNVREFKKAAKG